LDNPLVFKQNKSVDATLISVEFKDCKNECPQGQVFVESPLVKSLNINESPSKSLIVNVSLEKQTEYNIFYLREYRNKPDRVVIDIRNPDYAQKERETTNKINKLKRFNWIVVIDPGHGGEDPGAVTKRQYREKDIVFFVSNALCDYLNSQPGIRAYLTRQGDYFLSLRERIDIAHKYNADIFISIHANACNKKHRSGASVYYLSRDGATDEAAALLAEQENASDKIGGIHLGKDKILDSILIDLAQTFTINESIDLSGKILNELSSIKGLQKEGIKCANFAVLKSPSIPSVLVELAYITSPGDLKLLLSKSYQTRMANMISKGVEKFLEERPPKELPEETYAESAYESKDFKIHVVKRGETLWRISTLYKIPIEIIRKLNGLDIVSTILVGQELKIPAINN